MKFERKSVIPAAFSSLGKIRFIIICCLAASFVAAGCKKDDEEEEKPYITGSLSYSLPEYALVGKTFDLYAIGTLEQSDVTYMWTSATLLEDTVRASSCTVKIPDSLGIFSIVLTAQCEGYYDRTVTKYVTSIDPNLNSGSLTGVEYPDKCVYFTDSRDGKQYPVTKIGNLEWFASNLDWEGAGSPYVNAEAMGPITGRLYTWRDATGGVAASGLGKGSQGVCPEGWSVPTKEDWEDLAKAIDEGNEHPFETDWSGVGELLMVNAKLNGVKMWPYTPDCTPQNKMNWNALSGGNCTNDYNNYSNLMSYGFWWSSAEKDADNAFYRYIYYAQPDCYFNYTDKNSFGASVRCVRLAEDSE
ncbi:MAG: hypothetical protein IKY70_00210 [Bacteroidales bacterium]|nr:hypothetical protein [Bacteroidales bacterium]